ncbi:LysR family transcriptional regulator [Paraherbaspirillum soli]|uniref:LysR substrate-binding domain-containing protein n=1 Tax=Paraherbaspirillum soli TaxID=631222 RepID=A0ABW0M9A4_9BURK
MTSLQDYAAFVAVIDEGSLTAAARRLGRSVQAVSTALKNLEDELGLTLVTRTTRRCSPTPTGVKFAARLRTVLADIADAHAEALDEAAQLSGPIRIGASTLFGPEFLMPILAGFIERHPETTIELALSDRQVDLVKEGLDLAIRIGPMNQLDVKAKKLGLRRRVVVGAPGYLARRGRPGEPADLAQHDCILRRNASQKESWAFTSGNVEVRGRFSSDSALARHRAATLGLGLCMAPLWQVHSLVDAGQLELVLDAYELPGTPIHIVWPEGRTSRRVRAVIDLLAARLSLAGL